jgi:hypothetical protein
MLCNWLFGFYGLSDYCVLNLILIFLKGLKRSQRLTPYIFRIQMASWLEGVSTLAEIEVAQLQRRYSDCRFLSDSGASQTLQFCFHATDPVFKLTLVDGLMLTVTVPGAFPEEPVVVCVEDSGCGPQTQIVLDSCLERFCTKLQGEKYPSLRATLKWFDRNLEALFGLAREKESDSSENAQNIATIITETEAATIATSTTEILPHTTGEATTPTTEAIATDTTSTTTSTVATARSAGGVDGEVTLPSCPRAEWATHRNARHRLLQLNHHADLEKQSSAVVAAARALRRLPDKKVVSIQRDWEALAASLTDSEGFESKKLFPFLHARYRHTLTHLHKGLKLRRSTRDTISAMLLRAASFEKSQGSGRMEDLLSDVRDVRYLNRYEVRVRFWI